MHVQVAVVGAGIAGLSAARLLQRGGVSVRVFDKGRGPGGRTSTRRADNGDFDHGAQYLTARSEAFHAVTRQWCEAGVVVPWAARLIGTQAASAEDRQRFVPQPAMNSLARYLADGLPLSPASQIAQIRRDAPGWTLSTCHGEVCTAQALILAIPAPQVPSLVNDLSADIAAALDRVAFAPCWAVMADARDPHQHPPFDGAFLSEGPLAWVSWQSARPGRRSAGWVLHASPQWSEACVNAEADQVGPVLTEAFTQRFHIALAPGAVAHRWRFARVTRPAGKQPCLIDSGSGLILAGDWCMGERIEDAYLSGVAAGEAARLALQQ